MLPTREWPLSAAKRQRATSDVLRSVSSLFRMVFSRFAWRVQPRNYLLLACHLTNATAQMVQGTRFVVSTIRHWKSLLCIDRSSQSECAAIPLHGRQREEGGNPVSNTAGQGSCIVKDAITDFSTINMHVHESVLALHVTYTPVASNAFKLSI